MHFPGKTFSNVIYLLSRHQFSYNFFNATTQNKTGSLRYSPYITIESSALEPPHLINPQTGQPFDGKVDISLAANRVFGKTLFPNYSESDTVTFSTTSLGGISKKYFMGNFGLHADVIQEMFDKEMTIRFNLNGATLNAGSASFNYGIRVIGN